MNNENILTARELGNQLAVSLQPPFTLSGFRFLQVGPLFAIVDEEDYARARIHSWWLRKGYACATIKDRNVSLHRLILLLSDATVYVDHINGFPLDNRRCNLRLCTNSQNQMNRRKSAIASSRYKGVDWQSQRNCWRAKIVVGGVYRHIGFFTDECAAAMAYDNAARIHFGQFAQPNIDTFDGQFVARHTRLKKRDRATSLQQVET